MTRCFVALILVTFRRIIPLHQNETSYVNMYKPVMTLIPGVISILPMEYLRRTEMEIPGNSWQSFSNTNRGIHKRL